MGAKSLLITTGIPLRSLNTPVLTTTATPWPALEDRNCGWRCAPTPAAIAEALREAMRCDAASLRAMGAAGRTFVAQTLSWDRVAAEFVALYERLVRARGAAASPDEAAA